MPCVSLCPMLLLHFGSMERKIRVKVAEGAILQVDIQMIVSTGKEVDGT